MERLGLLAKTGITGIESCIFDRPFPCMESVIWPLDWLSEHVEDIKTLGVDIRSAHVSAENLARVLDALKNLAAKRFKVRTISI